MRAQEEGASTSSSMSSSNSCYYDVFLSFRGEDTRRNFTSHLYKALVQAGIQTFRDDDEIDRGENIKPELEKAIRQSRTSVVVFSKDYASSTWCLDELVLILKYRKTAKHAVLPVFYHVDPSHVRKQTNSIGDSFIKFDEQIKAEVDPRRKEELVERVNGWKDALKTAASLKGDVIVVDHHRNESDFIEDIVGTINRIIEPNNLNVPQHLVGIKSRIASINLWLRDGSSNVNTYVICGMGGVGKTTLAKCAYNYNFQQFEGSSFLEDVRKKSRTTTDRLALQNQLLSDIFKGRKNEITNLANGTSIIEKKLQSKRVLLVLDDVDNANKLDELLGTQKLCRGSKIIITTRVKLLLKTPEVFKEYVVEALNKSESLELLSWHAFKSITPLNDFGKQSQKVVQVCGGLPLALKVLGSSLRGKSIEVWDDTLRLLVDSGNVQIHDILRVSYNSLEYDQYKHLFLHIACFFVGEDRDCVTKILECDFSMIAGIEHLIDRCLLTISEGNELMMHRLIQKLGRDIVYQESPNDPGARSRLWRHDEAFKVLKGKKGTRKIEGLALDMQYVKGEKSMREPGYGDNIRSFFPTIYDSHFEIDISKGLSLEMFFPTIYNSPFEIDKPMREPGYIRRLFTPIDDSHFEIDGFEGMSNLKLLKLNNVQLVGNYRNFPGNLRWLRWHGFSLKWLPMEIPMEHLVTLDMRHSKLEQVWRGLKYVTTLRILDLSHSQELAKVPNFKGVPNLKELILQGCTNLVELCESIEHLKRLTLLDLKDCKNLMKLPTNIGTLASLEKLVISGCLRLIELPIGLRNLESLKELFVEGVGINQEPREMGQMERWLPHGFVSRWVSRPTHGPKVFFSCLPRCLRVLSLANCNIYDESFPEHFSDLAMQLEYLNLCGNPVRRLPDWVRNHNKLKELKLRSCKKLEPLLALPSSLQFLDLEYTSVASVTSSSAFAFDFVDVWFGYNSKLIEVEGYLKIEPIAEVDERIINNLGWGLCDVNSLRDVELIIIYTNHLLCQARRTSIEGLHEWGIFSTYVPLEKVPSWFSCRQPISHAHAGSSVTLTVPQKVRVQCLNVCAVYECSYNMYYGSAGPSIIKICNKTKDLVWIYCPLYCAKSGSEGNGDQVAWLSQWKFGNHLEAGDELMVTVFMGNREPLTDIDIKLVYGGEEEEDQTINKSRCVIGGDLSSLQLSTGVYFLYRGHLGALRNWTPIFFYPKDLCGTIFGDVSMHKEIDNWGWRGAGSGAVKPIYYESHSPFVV